MDEKVASLRGALRGRMKFYKLRALPQGSQQATTYNESVKVKKIPDHNDPYRIEWLDLAKEGDVIVGSKVRAYIGSLCADGPKFNFRFGRQVFQIADPQNSGYTVRWPFSGGSFNTEDYASEQEALSDIESMWMTILETEFQITRRTIKVYPLLNVFGR
jgi:actin-related protein 8